MDFESGLNTATNRRRGALGDSAEARRYIETLPRLGYRFICPVTSIPREASAVVAPQRPKPYRRLSLAAAVLAIVLAFAYIHLNASAPRSQPSFRQLTFRAGIVDSARFIPSSNSAAYSTTGEGGEPRTRTVSLDGASPRNLDFAAGLLASVSPRGELALISRPARLSRVSPNHGPSQIIAKGARAGVPDESIAQGVEQPLLSPYV